jgi:hypothetical protein
MRQRLFRRAGLGLLALVALLGVTETREWSAGADALEESDVALAQGDARGAIVHARTAAEAAVPFSPYPQAGYERLEEVARSAEQKGDLELAGFAWRAVRSAAVATRPAGAARGRVAEANDGILRLARSSLASSSLATRGTHESVIRDELSIEETPSPFFSLLVTFGALAFAAGFAALSRAVRSRSASRIPAA